MLLNLHIKNYALIDNMHIDFTPGLNIFTGETGAGKSIIIEALGLILGERASAQLIRKDANRCFITGEFDHSKLKGFSKYLDELGLDDSNNDTLILRREIDVSGKSRAFINDCPVSLSTLCSVGELLVDVHGQHEHQTLIKSMHQRQLLDRFGDNEDLKDAIGKKYHQWKELIAQKESFKLSEQEKQKLIDLYGFQVKEIDGARLTQGEEEEIEQILPKLKNAEKLREISEQASQFLDSMEGSVLEKLNKVQQMLENINNVCGSLGETCENLKTAYYQIEECAKEVEDFNGNLESDPERLNEILGRQDIIYKLKKKYGKTIGEILEYRKKIHDELSFISNTEENEKELNSRIEKEQRELFDLCKKLSASRKKAAEKISDEVEKQLYDLGMKKVRFVVSVEKEQEPTSDGWDRVEFIFSANPGEDLKPLKDIASGGEMSRVMLALKTVLAKADKVPILIFDEVDAGIGGPMGQTVGKKLKDLSKSHQILCITHLPQIAVFSNQHLSVVKELQKGQTYTYIKTLSEKEHTEEISRMLSGEKVTTTARKHAQELIKQSR
ncbi:MAG: DNA repair protein RecN [Endomicrobiales bacterium]|nr:DNA repair protein RecN [Endomicrobiales bacterium]